MKAAFFAPVLLLCALARADVSAVRRQVAHIETMKLARGARDSSDLSTEGARIVVLRDAHKVPRKIVADIYGETGRKQEVIYLHNGLPLFVRSVEKRYAAPLGTSARPRVASSGETRLYFDKGHLIEQRVGPKTSPLSAAQKRALELQTKASIRTYLGKS